MQRCTLLLLSVLTACEPATPVETPDATAPGEVDTDTDTDTGVSPSPSCALANGDAAMIGALAYSSIEAAIAAAVPGDEVLVCDGVHVEYGLQVTVPLTVASASGDRSAVTIDGDGQGAIFEVDGGELTLRSLTLTDGQGIVTRFLEWNSAGGAINAMIGAGGPAVVEDCRFERNRATLGGAIAARELTVTDSTFAGNSASSGGAIYMQSGGSLQITGGQMEGNTSESSGGAVYTESSATVQEVEFFENSAGASGGALTVYGPPDTDQLVLVGVTFEKNTASSGGAVAVHQALTVTADADTRFVRNEAGSGGAVYMQASAPLLTWTGGTFLDNVGGLGGALMVGSALAPVEIADVWLEGNHAEYGGAMDAAVPFAAALTLRDSTLLGNTASEAGGGLVVEAMGGQEETRSVTLSGLEIRQNRAPEGAGLVVAGAFVQLTDTILAENVAQRSGGAILLVDAEHRSSGGSAWLSVPSLEVSDTDLGSGATDNQPDDVAFYSDIWTYDGNAAFSCAEGVCQ